MAKKRKSSQGSVAGISHEGGKAHPDPMSAKEAEETLGAGAQSPSLLKTTTIDATPADAAGPPHSGVGDVAWFGNRAFHMGRLAERRLEVRPDLPDVRDRIYHPTLRALEPSIYPSISFPVRDQRTTTACTGFALAHVVDCLTHRETLPGPPRRVSARMLYEMAKRNDEWEGSVYDGSSIRGALSGFYRNGVCSDLLSPDIGDGEWSLTREMNKEARETRLGAYYRLQHDLSDYHAALNEIGAVLVSAQIHDNWDQPADGRIEPGGVPKGGHAFAIVGYDAAGFWVLNSWGEGWAKCGVAHWRYEDWASTIMDAWVLQLGIRAPTAFNATPLLARVAADAPQPSRAPNRSDIVGHFINIDDGRYVTGGRYGSPTPDEMQQTVGCILGKDGDAGYRHLAIYCHGGLNSLDDEANRIAVWNQRKIFRRNGIYNFHLMWGSGLLDEALGKFAEPQAGRAASVIGDVLLETVGRPIGQRAWRNMKSDASAAFSGDPDYDGGFYGLSLLLGALEKAERKTAIHLVGHSAGSIVLGEFLGKLERFKLSRAEIASIHLMAPACTVRFFKDRYGPYLSGDNASKLKDKIHIYNMTDQLELDDVVGFGGPFGYGRSLLYLVSRAYEDSANMPLAGMEKFAGLMPKSARLRIDLSKGPGPSVSATQSTSHGGFDNDPATLTTIMSRILGKKPPKPPTKDELVGY